MSATVVAASSVCLILMTAHSAPSEAQSLTSGYATHVQVSHQRGSAFPVASNGTEPSDDSMHEREYRPAREIRRFTEPTIALRGTAEDIGLDRRALESVLEAQFLQDFSF